MKVRHWLGYLLLCMAITAPLAMATDLPTKFSNQGSIVNTRHNLTQRQASGGPSGATMDTYRNDYGEVCVYCHTPHAANSDVKAPLWNRYIPNTTYATYDTGGKLTINQPYNQPGANSLSCLSCHDGQQAVDAIMNMPGSGKYTKTPNDSFLSLWTNPTGNQTYTHIGLNPDPAVGCLACHAPDRGIFSAVATDFTVFVIGTDLTNDHPVGVTFPTDTGGDTGWKTPGGTKGSTKFFDDNGNGNLDKTDIRLYDSGNGPAVECASCHDPHGVPKSGSDPTFIRTFLRKNNDGSMVCLTCHDK